MRDYPPMRSILLPNDQQQKEEDNSAALDPEKAARLFNPMCKPEYAHRLSQIISSNQAVVFALSHCQHCKEAKKLLVKNNVPYSEILFEEIIALDLMEVANCIFGEADRYVPYIYYNQERLGSYGELF